MLDVHMQRAMFVLLLMCIPISFIWAYTSKILMILGQDPEISRTCNQRRALLLQFIQTIRSFSHRSLQRKLQDRQSGNSATKWYWIDIVIPAYRSTYSSTRGTKKYEKLQDLVNEGVRKLEAQVGSLSDISMNMRDGFVSGSLEEVQKMCACAEKWLDSVMHPVSDSSKVEDSNIRFEYVSPTCTSVYLDFAETSIAEWYSLWHRRADAEDYPAEPSCVLFAPKLKFTFFDLTPASDYLLKVVSYCNMKEETWEVRFMRNSSNSISNSKLTPWDSSRMLLLSDGNSDECITEEEVTNNTQQGVEIVPFEYTSEPCSPSAQKSFWNEHEYVHCVKVIRSLECKRYIEKNFREKFLSWYSLRASGEEKMKVQEVVDALKDDPISLSGKLIHTFSQRIFSKRRAQALSSDLCMQMWH